MSLVEIDLLRVGEPMEMTPRPEEAYRIVVAVPWERRLARLYAFSLREPLPEIHVPLRQGEPEAVLSLGKLLGERYDAARYDLRLDYRQPVPEPPLPPEDAAWVEALLREKGFRPPAEDGREQAAPDNP